MALDHDATRVLILGDSHVFWAARFMRPAGWQAGEPANIVVQPAGQGGVSYKL